MLTAFYHKFIAFGLFLFLMVAATSAYALELKNVRFGTHPDKTRVVFEMDQPADFKAFTLPAEQNKPYRLILDLPDFTWSAGTITPPKGNRILDIRSGALKPGVKRIVIDMPAPVSIQNAFALPANGQQDGNRLVIDFHQISAQAFNTAGKRQFGTLDTTNSAIASTSQPTPAHNVSSNNLANKRPQTTGHRFFTDYPVASNMVVPTRKPTKTHNTKISSSAQSTQKTPLYKPLIVIDPGHGGADPGAIGANKSFEKHVTLAAAKELKRKLEATGRYRAQLTRDNDTYLKLYRRVSIARQAEADLFISLHADSIDKPNVRGASIYTLSNKASDAQTAKLAARENQADLIAGVDLSHEDKDVASILIDLAMRDTMNQSKFFANVVVTQMRAKGMRILEKPHRYAGFAVLKAPDIPSVLVEMGFMSNKNEAKLLATRDYQQRIANALSDSIDAYFQKIHKNNP